MTCENSYPKSSLLQYPELDGSLSLPKLISLLELKHHVGMESPVTADEADDSYRTLGVGRSLPGSHDIKL